MTELERLDQARIYMEKLANGIDPLTDQPIPEGEVVNHVQISRCLFYVSGLLRQLTERGGLPQPDKAAGKVPFLLSYGERDNFRFSETPMPISEIAKRINELIPQQTMTKLNYKHLSDWLTERGFLQTASRADGSVFRQPTASGVALGITTEKRQGSQGTYTVTVYNRAAQQFILDNLDGAVELSRRPRCPAGRPVMQGQPWTTDQEKLLMDLFQKRIPVKEIAASLKRTEEGVRSRLKKLGLISGSGTL